MRLDEQPFRPSPKPSHGRSKKTAKERGKVTPEVYEAAWIRSGGCCEKCGKSLAELLDDYWRHGGKADSLEGCHVERRWNYGQEGVGPEDLLILCGPQVNSGTCHHWIDSTREGKAWAMEKRDEIRGGMASVTDEPGIHEDLPSTRVQRGHDAADQASLRDSAQHGAGEGPQGLWSGPAHEDERGGLEIKFTDGRYHITEPV